MSLTINSQAPNFAAENTQEENNFHERMPEADAEGDLYGENGERTPYYPARPRQQVPYELVWDRRAPAGSDVGAESTRKGARADRSRPCVRLTSCLKRSHRRNRRAV